MILKDDAIYLNTCLGKIMWDELSAKLQYFLFHWILLIN